MSWSAVSLGDPGSDESRSKLVLGSRDRLESRAETLNGELTYVLVTVIEDSFEGVQVKACSERHRNISS